MVELGGKAVPIIGRVTMDMCMVVAGDDVRIGDVATIYGGLISLDEHAKACGTISYELLTALGVRIPRRYGSLRCSSHQR
jgi:alanine racemase